TVNPPAVLMALLSTVALAALLLLRRMKAGAGDPHRRVVALTVVALAVVAVASLLPLWDLGDPRPLDYRGLLAVVPNVFVAAAGAGAALLGRDRRWARWTGISLAGLGMGPRGRAPARPSGETGIRWQRITPTLLHRTELEGHVTELRSSPSGQRLAVRVIRPARGETRWVFRLLPATSGGSELAADDLAFLDDQRLLVVRRQDQTPPLPLVKCGPGA